MQFSIWILLLFTLTSIFQSCQEKITHHDIRRVVTPGTVSLTAFLGIQARNTSLVTECQKRITTHGLMFFEAFRYAIKKANNMVGLKNITLGYHAINTCSSWKRIRRPVLTALTNLASVGVIGPPTSDEAELSSPSLDLFYLSMISHSATSISLENRDSYSNFFRTVPSDRYVIDALLHILNALRWDYISVIGSHGSYGQRGLEHFVNFARSHGVCIWKRIAIIKNPSQLTYKLIIKELLGDERAKSVVLFLSVQDTVELLKTAKLMNISKGRLVWVSDGHFFSAFTKETIHLADGSIVLQFDSGRDEMFEQYFKNLNPSRANYTWFHLYWEDVFNCNIVPKLNERSNCSGAEELRWKKLFDPFIPVKAMIKAANVFICGLKEFLKTKCKTHTILCLRYNSMHFRIHFRHFLSIANLKCKDILPEFPFLENGGILPTFKAVRLVQHGNTTKFINIGKWKAGRNYSSTLNMFWNGTVGSQISKMKLFSTCSLPCTLNEYKVKDGAKRPCCWKCLRCKREEIVLNNTCQECPAHSAPNKYGGCTTLPLHHINTSGKLSIVTLVFSFIGVKLTTVVLGIYFKHWDSRIVKAAGKELTSIMIIGLYLSFMTPIFFLSKPNVLTCGVQRFAVGVSLTSCYTPLLLKTNRIYRIFQGAKNARIRPSFISPQSQILICFALISIQILFGVTWVVTYPPRLAYLENPAAGGLTVSCSESEQAIVLNLVICCVMMLMCTYFAFKTRKCPKNYNECRSIVLTMYISCFVWGIFVPMFFFTKAVDLSRIYIVCVFCLVIAYVTLIGLFESRVRLLLFSKISKEDEKSFSSNTPMRRLRLPSNSLSLSATEKSETPSNSALKLSRHRLSSNLDKSVHTETEDVDM